MKGFEVDPMVIGSVLPGSRFASRFFAFMVGSCCNLGVFAVAKTFRQHCLKKPKSTHRQRRQIEALAMKRPIVFAFLASLLVAVAADSVVEELEKNGLPGGLLPSSVTSYSIGKDGDFRVSLEAPCYAQIEDQLAYYGANITGTLKFGSISNLDGIETKQLFVWLPVTGIYVDVPATPYIYFEIGVLTKRLALAAFETPLTCDPGSHAVEAGFHISSLAVDSELGGSQPREALQ